jgi:hypothetical protein
MNVDPNNARAIFLQAVEMYSPDQWDSFLNEACGDDSELQRQVKILLDAHVRAGSFLDQGAVATTPTINQPITEREGTVIGPYKLLEQIGEGGMGVVYMADQTGQTPGRTENHQARHGYP